MSKEPIRKGRPPLEMKGGKPTKISPVLYKQVQARAIKTYRSICGEINYLLEWALENIKDGDTK